MLAAPHCMAGNFSHFESCVQAAHNRRISSGQRPVRVPDNANRKVLSQSFMLGLAGVGILSTLTILRGLDLSSLGYRAPISWGSAPWESYIPRSIGLPDMQGGLHSIYILAFLPLAFLLAANMHTFRRHISTRLFGACVAVLGLVALLFASYRSGWLGLLVSLYCLVWINYRTH